MASTACCTWLAAVSAVSRVAWPISLALATASPAAFSEAATASFTSLSDASVEVAVLWLISSILAMAAWKSREAAS